MTAFLRWPFGGGGGADAVGDDEDLGELVSGDDGGEAEDAEGGEGDEREEDEGGQGFRVLNPEPAPSS